MLNKFNINCTSCERLSNFLIEVRKKHPNYHAKPVAPFGADKPKLLIVGLAPGMHGANASGRPFTGDHAGILLYETLYKYGFSNKPDSLSADDKLQLKSCLITNAVKCLPPNNKPTTFEINKCNAYLTDELKGLKKNSIILCLGTVSHKAVIKALSLKQSAYKFKHGNFFEIKDKFVKILDSYHCSRYNTQTKRLTRTMFYNIFDKIKIELEK